MSTLSKCGLVFLIISAVETPTTPLQDLFKLVVACIGIFLFICCGNDEKETN